MGTKSVHGLKGRLDKEKSTEGGSVYYSCFCLRKPPSCEWLDAGGIFGEVACTLGPSP